MSLAEIKQIPRKKGDTDTGGPVWKLGSELVADEFLPTPEELEDFKKTIASKIRQAAGERKIIRRKQ